VGRGRGTHGGRDTRHGRKQVGGGEVPHGGRENNMRGGWGGYNTPGPAGSTDLQVTHPCGEALSAKSWWAL